MKIFLLIVISITIPLLFVLALSTSYSDITSQYFWHIAGFTSIVVIILFIILIQQILKLREDYKHRTFGIKLTLKLIKTLTWTTAIPSLFIFIISGQFITYSINSWFNSETLYALERSIDLSKYILDESLEKSYQLSLKESENIFKHIEKNKIESLKLSENNVFSKILVYKNKQLIAKKNNKDLKDDLPLPIASIFPVDWNDLSQTKYNTNINNKMYSQIWFNQNINQQNYVLLFRIAIDDNINRNILPIENARARYASITYTKSGLHSSFIIALLLATLLSIIIAWMVAFYFARRLVSPIASLANATQAVAQGDFSQRANVYHTDEIGMLATRFNRMTEQLQAAQNATSVFYKQQEEYQHYLESILSSLLSGVITIDYSGRLKTYNQSALNILDFPMQTLVDKKLEDWQDNEQAWQIAKFLQSLIDSNEEQNVVQIDYFTESGKNLTLSGKSINLNQEQVYILIFDDITNLISSQKEAAWGEVARRLAHEIKNPLTPIQLSAERLAWKLSDKLNEQDANILQRSTNTIIEQVSALQEMVEQFRNYAHSTTLKRNPIDLNELIKEVLTLYNHSTKCSFNATLYKKTITINADSTAIRQVLHNLFKNAQEAALEGENPTVNIHTTIDNNKSIIIVQNNGKIFDEAIIHKVFEPYVTNKKNGTGLGLAVVKKIVEEHNGTITVMNEDGFAVVKIVIPLINKTEPL